MKNISGIQEWGAYWFLDDEVDSPIGGSAGLDS